MFEGALRELVGAVPILDFALQAPDHYGAQLGRFGRDAAGEALVVEQFQKRGEALLVAVVRGRGEEELVFEVGGQIRGSPGFVASRAAIIAPCRRVRRCGPRRRSGGRSRAGGRRTALGGNGLPEHAQRTLTLDKSIEVISRGKWVHGLA